VARPCWENYPPADALFLFVVVVSTSRAHPRKKIQATKMHGGGFHVGHDGGFHAVVNTLSDSADTEQKRRDNQTTIKAWNVSVTFRSAAIHGCVSQKTPGRDTAKTQPCPENPGPSGSDNGSWTTIVMWTR
jgi:hypothetical protein